MTAYDMVGTQSFIADGLSLFHDGLPHDLIRVNHETAVDTMQSQHATDVTMGKPKATGTRKMIGNGTESNDRCRKWMELNFSRTCTSSNSFDYRVGNLISYDGQWFRITESYVNYYAKFLAVIVGGIAFIMLPITQLGISPIVIKAGVSFIIMLIMILSLVFVIGVDKLDVTARLMDASESRNLPVIGDDDEGRFVLSDGVTKALIPGELKDAYYTYGYSPRDSDCDQVIDGTCNDTMMGSDSGTIQSMLDGYLNDLAMVGVNSNTGDNMDLIADYWDEVANGVPDDDMLEYSAEFIEPIRALGGVVGLYVRMLKAKTGFYSEDDIESARRALNESEGNMLTMLRKAGRRMTEDSRSKAESSVGYLRLSTSEAFG